MALKCAKHIFGGTFFYDQKIIPVGSWDFLYYSKAEKWKNGKTKNVKKYIIFVRPGPDRSGRDRTGPVAGVGGVAKPLYYHCFGTIEHFLARTDMKISEVCAEFNFLQDFIGFKTF